MVDVSLCSVFSVPRALFYWRDFVTSKLDRMLKSVFNQFKGPILGAVATFSGFNYCALMILGSYRMRYPRLCLVVQLEIERLGAERGCRTNLYALA